jgi:hypothetical protein
MYITFSLKIQVFAELALALKAYNRVGCGDDAYYIGSELTAPTGELLQFITRSSLTVATPAGFA